MNQLVEVPPLTFREEGFLHDYPTKESSPKGWPFLGYLSEMVNLALNKDDPAAFVYFMRLAGCDRNSRTFDDLSMESYCDKRKAPRCRKALAQLK